MKPENLHELVTFRENSSLPVYNWFYFKEGYGRSLITWLVKEFDLKEPILDPFCGSGTTLLAAKELGLESAGFDIMPLSVLASKVKTRNYDEKELAKELKKLKEVEMNSVDMGFIDKKIRKLFYSKNLEKIVFYWNKINEIREEETREFFLLALISITGKASNTIKAGGSLRKKKKGFVNVKKIFLRKAEEMIKDIKKAGINGKEPEVFLQDARNFRLEEGSIGSIITSPPYLNKIEYASVYKLELGLFFRQKQPLLKSFLGDSTVKVYGEFAGMPLIAQSYFNDLKKVLKNSFHCLKKTGRMFVVVAGGCLPDRIIQSDEIIASLAQDEGFRLVEVITAREIGCMKNRTQLMGKTRESIVVLEKD